METLKEYYEVGKGWWPLVEQAENLVEEWNKNHDEKHQVEYFRYKEKFGLLDIHCYPYYDELAQKLIEIERESCNICEMCGTKENVRRDYTQGWLYTLCDKCREEKEKHLLNR